MPRNLDEGIKFVSVRVTTIRESLKKRTRTRALTPRGTFEFLAFVGIDSDTDCEIYPIGVATQCSSTCGVIEMISFDVTQSK